MSAIRDAISFGYENMKTPAQENMLDQARDELNDLQERVEAQQKMLKRLEWVIWAVDDEYECPMCRRPAFVGHAPDCELAALLKETT